MFWGGQCCLVSIGGAGSYLPAHNIPNKKNSMIDRTLATPNNSKHAMLNNIFANARQC